MQSEGELNVLQKNIIKSLAVFHDLCVDNNLTYYLTGGTLLGAVRHKGIIPWDDDVDVCMPREDYLKLLKLADKLPNGFSVGYFELDKNYVYPFAKFYNDTILVKETFGTKSYTNGVWIDIFPLDGTFNSKPAKELHFYLVKKLRFLFELKVRGYQAPTDKSNYVLYFLKVTLKPLVYTLLYLMPQSFIFNLMERLASIKQARETKFSARLYSQYGIKASFNKEVFDEQVELSFNEHKFFGPIGYDEYLTNLYGDYMTPPPPQERQTHNIEIVNLKESAE